MNSLGIDYATDYIQRFGFTKQQLPHNLTLALGTTQVTPIEMARAYSVFANGGFKVEPYYIDKVVDGNGKVVLQTDTSIVCVECEDSQVYKIAETSAATQRITVGNQEYEAGAAEPANSGNIGSSPEETDSSAPRVISPQNVYLMTDMMKDVIRRGTATRALVLKRGDIAGKTGTTNDRRDTWFCGFNPSIAAAAWIGFDQERSLGNNEEGGRTALPMWIYFMADVLRNQPEQQLPAPTGLVTMRIAADTGRIATIHDTNVIFETFMQGHLPENTAPSVNNEVPSPPAGSEISDELF